MQLTPDELKHALEGRLLSFPLTDFADDGSFDPTSFSARLDWLSGFGAGAHVIAGGAGEFFSLRFDEYRAVLETAFGSTVGSTPMIASIGYGTRIAVDLAAEAERLGAAGLLLLPPYLTEASQEGLFAHVYEVCRATRLGVILYNRANMRIRSETLARLAEACPNLVGFKDGIGDTEEILRISSLLHGRVLCINGMPTAEVFAPAYCGMGVPTYSSAIFNFVPRSAMAYHAAVVRGDLAAVRTFGREFLLPYCALRARRQGYAVSIVKAGAQIVGRSAGQVRPPLPQVTPEEYAELGELIEKLGPQT